MRKFIVDFGNRRVSYSDAEFTKSVVSDFVYTRKRNILVLSEGVSIKPIDIDNPKRPVKRNRNI